MVNERQTYALIDKETKKVIKYHGRLQYYRLRQRARIEKARIQNDWGIKIEITNNKPTQVGPLKNEEKI